jgi:predicted DNA-binding protein (MmcQ/YjbR family)
VTPDQLRDLCLGFPGSEETFPFSPGTPVYKVAGKVFALRLHTDELSVNLKCEPALAEQLRAAHPEITPGYHMNKAQCTLIPLRPRTPGSASGQRPGRTPSPGASTSA